MATLDDLPDEILSLIFSFLNLPELLRLPSVNSRFYDIVNLVYFKWRRCHFQCSSKSTAADNITFCEVRHHLFSHYGQLVGSWGVSSTVYGGLVNVKFDGFQLVGTRYYAPANPHIDRPLRAKKLFSVHVNDERECEFFCHRGFNGPHAAILEKEGDTGFRLACDNELIHRHPAGINTDFEQWFCEELGVEKFDNTQATQLLKDKHKVLSEEVTVRCYPLELPSHIDGAVIQPGLFKGTYSAHGIELVLLKYDERNNVTITKVTGDPNIPATKVTIEAFLYRPVVMSVEQQSSLTLWSAMNDIEDVYCAQVTTGATIPFRLPSSFQQRYTEIPQYCKARFRSQGQIAGESYSEPRFITGHWVVFDEDTFGHVWFLLSAFAMYSRVQENF